MTRRFSRGRTIEVSVPYESIREATSEERDLQRATSNHEIEKLKLILLHSKTIKLNAIFALLNIGPNLTFATILDPTIIAHIEEKSGCSIKTYTVLPDILRSNNLEIVTLSLLRGANFGDNTINAVEQYDFRITTEIKELIRNFNRILPENLEEHELVIKNLFKLYKKHSGCWKDIRQEFAEQETDQKNEIKLIQGMLLDIFDPPPPSKMAKLLGRFSAWRTRRIKETIAAKSKKIEITGEICVSPTS